MPKFEEDYSPMRETRPDPIKELKELLENSLKEDQFANSVQVDPFYELDEYYAELMEAMKNNPAAVSVLSRVVLKLMREIRSQRQGGYYTSAKVDVLERKVYLLCSIVLRQNQEAEATLSTPLPNEE